MYKYSKSSLDKLDTVHPDLRQLCFILIQIMDVTIIEGVRTPERQTQLVKQGLSKTTDSKHLKQSDGYSHAVDIAPYPVDWNDRERFIFMQGIIQGLAKTLGLKIRSGVDWDSDGDIKEHKFFDGPHIELVR